MQIPKFIMSEDLLTGIEEIDSQHCKLLSWGNALSSDDFENAVHKVGRVLHNLSRYVSYHFQAEENAMIKNHYEMIEKHQKQHERLMFEVGKLVRKYNEEGATKGLLVELQYQFLDWFIHHIKEWDKPFAAYLTTCNFDGTFTIKEEEPTVNWAELDLPD